VDDKILGNSRLILNRITSLLLNCYPDTPQRANLFPEPLDELILTILSQNTTDTNSKRAFKNLMERYPDYNVIIAEDPDIIAGVIKVAGLNNIKSRRIIDTLREIRNREGVLSLRKLATMSNDKAIEYLTSLKGVGYKTAYCVLAFSLNRDVIPVDTHIYRVGVRVGFIPVNFNPEKAHFLLNQVVDGNNALNLHLALISHGRKVCLARKPDCEACCINTHCSHYNNGNPI